MSFRYTPARVYHDALTDTTSHFQHARIAACGCNSMMRGLRAGHTWPAVFHRGAPSLLLACFASWHMALVVKLTARHAHIQELHKAYSASLLQSKVQISLTASYMH